MTTAKRLTEVVPVRVSRKHKVQLRRWARESGVDVSKVVRDMIEERQRRAGEGESLPVLEIAIASDVAA